jgi:hypothetical protein
MSRLIAHFRAAFDLVVSAKTAQRLADTVRGMRRVDGGFRLGVTGTDRCSLVPRHVDLTLQQLRAILAGRRVA